MEFYENETFMHRFRNYEIDNRKRQRIQKLTYNTDNGLRDALNEFIRPILEIIPQKVTIAE